MINNYNMSHHHTLFGCGEYTLKNDVKKLQSDCYHIGVMVKETKNACNTINEQALKTILNFFDYQGINSKEMFV